MDSGIVQKIAKLLLQFSFYQLQIYKLKTGTVNFHSPGGKLFPEESVSLPA